MKVVIAGYNIEAEEVERLLAQGAPLTPEVIAASYARISRDPRSVAAIRRDAREDVERARRSNERIVFGMGHASIAEHAVFNIDVSGISRLAVEELEHFRLASFTEKSQRYIKLGRDIVVPKEVRAKGSRMERRFRETAGRLQKAYSELYRVLLDRGYDEGIAREDARYAMPLATAAQLGMTVNARELEYMIARLSAHPLSELQKLSGMLYKKAKVIAPSLIRYPDATDYFKNIARAKVDIGAEMRQLMKGAGSNSYVKVEGNVRLLDWTRRGDERIVAAILFSSSNVTMGDALEAAGKMNRAEKVRVIEKAMKGIESHDSVLREFESVHMLFEFIVSASCFAQLKRHRLATIIPQNYDLSLGISVPHSIDGAGAVRILRDAARDASDLYRELVRCCPGAADYILTNAHRRRVLFDVNMREIYHFVRLRSDRHAQWEIREVSGAVALEAKRQFPSASIYLSGKDEFDRKS